MRFRVTRHAAVKPPMDALSRLFECLPPRREDVQFVKAGDEIRARLDSDELASRTEAERAEIGREAVLRALSEVCERSPELKLDWFAISPAR